MKHALTTLLFCALSVTTSVHAATITYETRKVDSGVNTADYQLSWGSQTSTISSQSLTDFKDVFAGNDTFSHLTVQFSSNSKPQIDFQIGPDGGYGGALYFDGAKLDEKQYDIWWNNNWNNTGNLLTASISNLASGNHILEVFWAEKCCNGNNNGRFSIDGGATWQNLSTRNLDNLATSAVPVPAAMWLFGSALIGLTGLRRKSRYTSVYML